MDFSSILHHIAKNVAPTVKHASASFSAYNTLILLKEELYSRLNV